MCPTRRCLKEVVQVAATARDWEVVPPVLSVMYFYVTLVDCWKWKVAWQCMDLASLPDEESWLNLTTSTQMPTQPGAGRCHLTSCRQLSGSRFEYVHVCALLFACKAITLLTAAMQNGSTDVIAMRAERLSFYSWSLGLR